ncbi:hypothetical protein BEWA_025430 [Theileria equi strain WA]|uniref:Signal peptide containing protein n=1 Tax=Theileria equi strain WA TaxID=1537102 RepID=L0AXQ9_THEEQ|nr:hypothetical protein BEWA_025430 [Theileria equi strain WA]AFZ79694.1 hypothetical protein BEWA_025430 [Theileria equi strain WA]|eukprot:XP_004829360.1 hypothetical protein BEWA_025430 [Theileria equi strain WA]
MKLPVLYTFLILSFSHYMGYGSPHGHDFVLNFSNLNTTHAYKYESSEGNITYITYFPCYDGLFHKVLDGIQVLWEASGPERCRVVFVRSIGDYTLATLYVWYFSGKSELRYFMKKDRKWEFIRMDLSSGYDRPQKIEKPKVAWSRRASRDELEASESTTRDRNFETQKMDDSSSGTEIPGSSSEGSELDNPFSNSPKDYDMSEDGGSKSKFSHKKYISPTRAKMATPDIEVIPEGNEGQNYGESDEMEIDEYSPMDLSQKSLGKYPGGSRENLRATPKNAGAMARNVSHEAIKGERVLLPFSELPTTLTERCKKFDERLFEVNEYYLNGIPFLTCKAKHRILANELRCGDETIWRSYKSYISLALVYFDGDSPEVVTLQAEKDGKDDLVFLYRDKNRWLKGKRQHMNRLEQLYEKSISKLPEKV